MISTLKNLRVALRPLVLAVSSNTVLARLLREVGEEAGYSYPEKPVEKEMLGPIKVLN